MYQAYQSPYGYPTAYSDRDRRSKSLQDADPVQAAEVNHYLNLRIQLGQQENRLCVIGKDLASQNFQLDFAFLDTLDEPRQCFLNRSVFDGSIQASLIESGVINWVVGSGHPSNSLQNSKGVCRLETLRTHGDGNCLLHGLSMAMWGVDDTQLRLRKALHKAVAEGSAADELRERWRCSMESENRKLGFTLDESQWQQEWMEHIVQISSPVPKMDGLSYDSLARFHIFVAAQVLQRPIVCYADEVMSGAHGEFFAPVNMAGLYLPIMSRPNACVKSPLMIAYAGGHFAGLVRRDNTGVIPLCHRNRSRLPIPFLKESEEADQEKLLDRYLKHGYVNVLPPAGEGPSGYETFQPLDVADFEQALPALPITKLMTSFVSKFEAMYLSDLAARCRTKGCECFHGELSEYCSTCEKKRAARPPAANAYSGSEVAASEISVATLPPTAPPALREQAPMGAENPSNLVCSTPFCRKKEAPGCGGLCNACHSHRPSSKSTARDASSNTAPQTAGHSHEPVPRAIDDLDGMDRSIVKCVRYDCRRIGDPTKYNFCPECYADASREKPRRNRSTNRSRCRELSCNHSAQPDLEYCNEHQLLHSHRTQGPAAHAPPRDVAGVEHPPRQTPPASSAMASPPGGQQQKCSTPGCGNSNMSSYKKFCDQCMTQMEELWLASRQSKHRWTCSKVGCEQLIDPPRNYCATCTRSQQRVEKQRQICQNPACNLRLDPTTARQYGGFCKAHFLELGGEVRCKTAGCRFHGAQSLGGYCSNCSEKLNRAKISSQQAAALRDARTLTQDGELDDTLSVIPCVSCQGRIQGIAIQGMCDRCYRDQRARFDSPRVS